jgi:hypothetical protein
MDPTTPWQLFYSESVGGSFTTGAVTSAGVVKRGPVCTAGLSYLSGREFGDFLEVAINGAGKSVISYVDVSSTGQVAVVTQQ